MPTEYDLDVYRGDTYVWTFTVFEDDGTTPYGLTDATAEAEIRVATGSPVLATLVCTITQPNTIEVALAAADSGMLSAAVLRWDLQLTWPGDTVTTIVAGAVNVTGDITDSGTVLLAAAPVKAWEKQSA
jgi:hypothetical protein